VWEHKGHKIFTEEEAIENKIEYVPWNDDSVETGMWIITDDRKVLELLKVYHAVNSRGVKNNIIKTCLGQIVQSKKRSFKSDEHLPMGSSSRHSKKATAREKRVIDLILGGIDPLDAVSMIYPTNHNAKRTIREIMKKEGVVKYMQSKLEDAFHTVGINEEWFAQRLHDEAINEKNLGNVRLDALKTISKLLGYEPNSVRITDERSVVFDGNGSGLKKLEQKREVRALTDGTNNMEDTGSGRKSETIKVSGQLNQRTDSKEFEGEIS